MNPGGFTLVETVFSLVVVAILMLAVGSALRLALLASGGLAVSGANGTSGYAGSVGAAAAASRAVAADAADQIAADLNVALNFTEKTPTAVTFTVPDRDNNSTPETIRYAWFGAGGNPLATPAVPAYTLTRAYNGGAWVALASDVRQCNFSLLYRQMTVTPAPTEQLLFSWNPASGTTQQQFVSTTTWAAGSFQASVPADTTSYSITRVRLMVLCDAIADGIMKVQIRPTTGAATYKPTAAALATVRVPELAGSDSGMWVDVNFPSAHGFNPALYYSIVVGGESGTTYGGGVVTAAGAPTTQKGYLSTNGGTTVWGAMTGTQYPKVYVYGTIP